MTIPKKIRTWFKCKINRHEWEDSWNLSFMSDRPLKPVYKPTQFCQCCKIWVIDTDKANLERRLIEIQASITRIQLQRAWTGIKANQCKFYLDYLESEYLRKSALEEQLKKIGGEDYGC